MNYFEIFKKDCQVNDKVILKFSDSTSEGYISELSKNYIRLKNEKGKKSLYTANAFESLVSYEVFSENNDDNTKPLLIESQPNVVFEYPEFYSKFKQHFDSLEFNFPNINQQFSVKKGINQYNVDEQTYSVHTQLNGLKNRYDYALKQPDVNNKLQEILNILTMMLSINYLDDDIRYNIAFINQKLNKPVDAINVLKDTPTLESKSEINLVLSFLFFSLEKFESSARHFAIYLGNKAINIEDKDFLFFIQLISKTKHYEALQALLKIKQDKIEDVYPLYIASLLLIEINGFIQEFNYQLKNHEGSCKEFCERNINMLFVKTGQLLKEEVNEKPIIKEDFISTNAEIYNFRTGSNFGFLKYFNGQNNQIIAQFMLTDVLEDELKEKIQGMDGQKTIHVFACIDKTDGILKKAYAIQSPKNINKVLDLAEQILDKKNYLLSNGIVKEVLRQFSTNDRAIKLSQRLKNLKIDIVHEPPKKLQKPAKKLYGSFYREANFARGKRDWESAKKWFLLAIENNDNKESAIKDLAQIYAQAGNHNAAISIVEKHIESMSNKISALNVLANLYSSAGQFKKSAEFLNKLLKQPELKGTIDIKRRLAYCYFKDNNFQRAKDLLSQILRTQPNDAPAKKWLDALIEGEETGTYEEANKLFNETDFSILITGISALMQDTLEKCEFKGVPATIKANRTFTFETLSSIRRLIDTAGKARPEERAGYLLTEAVLMKELQPEQVYQFKSVLARYCNAMALICASENLPSDVIRNYYIEAFSLENNWKSIAPQVSIYLASFYLNGEQIVKENQKSHAVDKILSDINELSKEPDFFWDGILEISITNPSITAQLMNKIYLNERAKKGAFVFLNSLNIPIDNNASEGDFKNQWNMAREKRKREFDRWVNSVKALIDQKSLEVLMNVIDTSLQALGTPWLQKTDSFRLDSINKDIVRTIKDYLVQVSFDEKDRLYAIASTSIERTIEEIKAKPTRFSYEGLMPLLLRMQELLSGHFDNILKISTPIVSIKIMGESAAINNQIEVQISINNQDKQKSPVYDISLKIEDTDSCQLVGEPVFTPEVLKGGDERVVKLKAKISDDVIKNKIGDIKFVCSYRARNSEELLQITSEQTINLYDESEFKPIDNIYARFANSNAVTDKSMFFGRDEFINDVVKMFLSSNSKCILIYGQKRSGKSSVLYHLKDALNKTGKAFCISFSLGSIITEWSIANFFYKILSEIVKEINKLKRQELSTFDFKRISFEELEKRPVGNFEEIMDDFIEQCTSLDDWKEKRFVVMIDEFTYLYSAIQKDSIPSDFMHVWKAMVDKNYFSSVLVGQDVMPHFKANFPNDFGVTEDRRLTYLKEEDARDLIERPIWFTDKDESRYIGKAVDKILEYTACNPYYIQIFCARLVEFLNERKAIRVTEVTVKDVAESLIKGNQSLGEDKFDNLITAGDADLEAIPVNYTRQALKQIAYASRHLGACSKDEIKERLKDESEISKRLDDILNDLKNRDVLSVREGFYKINVQLFRDWLINH